jgi:hypothetical protein
VASDFGDGERLRLAFYAERSFRDTQLANLANQIAYLLELIFFLKNSRFSIHNKDSISVRGALSILVTCEVTF